LSAVERHLAVPRTARYYVQGAAAADASEVWFGLHGYGQLAGRFLRHLAPLDDGRRCLVAPEGLSRFYLESGRSVKVGACWMTREDRLSDIADYVRYLDALGAAVLQDRPGGAGIVVLGFSQGTATGARWLAQGTVRADHLILWGGEVPPDLDLAAARERWTGMRLTLVAGSTDPYITPKILARDEERLRAHGIAYRVERFTGGHELVPELLLRVAS
jgi:predicted esterase